MLLKLALLLIIIFIYFFPYSIFIPHNINPLLDKLDPRILAEGKEELKKHKLIILGISRDNQARISPVISHLEALGKQFADYKVVIFENDSFDGTKILLRLWSVFNDKVNILSEDFNLKKRPSIKFLADIRNRYLDYITDKFPDFDILMIMDMDMHHGWDQRGVYDSFAKIDKWDAVCANGTYTKHGNMWDAFAFRSQELPLGIEAPNYWGEIVPMLQKIYPIATNLVPVWSCFNGMAFYKRKAMQFCRYDSINNDCEHVMFHNCIRKKNNGQMFLNPSMVIEY